MASSDDLTKVLAALRAGDPAAEEKLFRSVAEGRKDKHTQCPPRA